MVLLWDVMGTIVDEQTLLRRHPELPQDVRVSGRVGLPQTGLA